MADFSFGSGIKPDVSFTSISTTRGFPHSSKSKRTRKTPSGRARPSRADRAKQAEAARENRHNAALLFNIQRLMSMGLSREDAESRVAMNLMRSGKFSAEEARARLDALSSVLPKPTTAVTSPSKGSSKKEKRVPQMGEPVTPPAFGMTPFGLRAINAPPPPMGAPAPFAYGASPMTAPPTAQNPWLNTAGFMDPFQMQ